MLSLSSDQLGQISDVTKRRAEDTLVEDVSRLQREQFASLAQRPEPEIRQIVQAAMDCGLTAFSDIRFYALSALVLGPNFATRLPWASAILQDGLPEPGRRIFDCAVILLENHLAAHAG